MYRLTLTQSERAALDFVGYRYRHGDDLYRLLWVECTCKYLHPQTGALMVDIDADGNEIQWDSQVDFEFDVPEHISWEIMQIKDDDCGDWTSFDANLATKLNDFCNKIV